MKPIRAEKRSLIQAFLLTTALALGALGATAPALAEDGLAEKLSRIKLPPGFSIGVFAEGLENARSMALGEKQTLFVGTRRKGDVYAVKLDRIGGRWRRSSSPRG